MNNNYLRESVSSKNWKTRRLCRSVIAPHSKWCALNTDSRWSLRKIKSRSWRDRRVMRSTKLRRRSESMTLHSKNSRNCRKLCLSSKMRLTHGTKPITRSATTSTRSLKPKSWKRSAKSIRLRTSSTSCSGKRKVRRSKWMNRKLSWVIISRSMSDWLKKINGYVSNKLTWEMRRTRARRNSSVKFSWITKGCSKSQMKPIRKFAC